MKYYLYINGTLEGKFSKLEKAKEYAEGSNKDCTVIDIDSGDAVWENH